MTSRMARPDGISMMTGGGEKKRMKGLESIYLQKFDKKAGRVAKKT